MPKCIHTWRAGYEATYEDTLLTAKLLRPILNRFGTVSLDYMKFMILSRKRGVSITMEAQSFGSFVY